MKNKLLLLLGLLLFLIGLAVCLIMLFLGFYQKSTVPEDMVLDSTAFSQEPVDYVMDNWHFEDAQWNEDTHTLTAIKSFDLSYEEAQKIGGNIFTEDLSPESYLPQALTMAADLNSRLSITDAVVILDFRGRDDTTLFTVDSIGHIQTCWDNPS